MGDFFTKWIDAILVKNKKAVTMANQFITHIVAIFGVQIQIHSDQRQGQTFESEVLKELCQVLGIYDSNYIVYTTIGWHDREGKQDN